MKIISLKISLKLMFILLISGIQLIQSSKSTKAIKENIFVNEIDQPKPESPRTSYLLSFFFDNKKSDVKQEEIEDLRKSVVVYLDYKNYNQEMLIGLLFSKVTLLMLLILMTNSRYEYSLILITLSVASDLIKSFVFFPKSMFVIGASVGYLLIGTMKIYQLMEISSGNLYSFKFNNEKSRKERSSQSRQWGFSDLALLLFVSASLIFSDNMFDPQQHSFYSETITSNMRCKLIILSLLVNAIRATFCSLLVALANYLMSLSSIQLLTGIMFLLLATHESLDFLSQTLNRTIM